MSNHVMLSDLIEQQAETTRMLEERISYLEKKYAELSALMFEDN